MCVTFEVQTSLTYHNKLSWWKNSSENKGIISNFSADDFFLSFDLSGVLENKNIFTTPSLNTPYFESWKIISEKVILLIIVLGNKNICVLFVLRSSLCFFSAFLRDFSLWLDQLSGDGASYTWRSPAM